VESRSALQRELADKHAEGSIMPADAPLPSKGNCANPRLSGQDTRVEERMADHGEVEYATAQGNDLPAHVAMYDRFVHWIVVGGAHVVNIVLGLAIGGVAGHWLLAFAIFVIATIVAFHGFLSGARMPSVVMVIISLITLALASGG
jgi:Bacterial aa3 type cytochrome c oxidase subunit IV